MSLNDVANPISNNDVTMDTASASCNENNPGQSQTPPLPLLPPPPPLATIATPAAAGTHTSNTTAEGNTSLPLPPMSPSNTTQNASSINVEKQSETETKTKTETVAATATETSKPTPIEQHGDTNTPTPKHANATPSTQTQKKTTQSRRSTPVKLNLTQRPFIGTTLDEYFRSTRKKNGMDVDDGNDHDDIAASDGPDGNDSDYDPYTAEHNIATGGGGKIGTNKRKASRSGGGGRSWKRRKHSNKTALGACDASEGDTLLIHEANGWVPITHAEAEAPINALPWTEFRAWLKQTLVPMSHHDLNKEAQSQKFARKLQRLLSVCTPHSSLCGTTQYCLWLQVPQKEKWILLEIKAGDWYTNCTSEETMMGYATQKGTHNYWFVRVCESLLHKDNTVLLLRADKGGICGELVWLQKGVYVSGTDALAIENALSEALNLQWTYLHDDSKIVMGGNNTRKNSALYLKTVRAVARQQSWYAQALYHPFTCSNWPCQNDRDQTGVEPGSVFNQNAQEYKRAIEYVRRLGVAEVRRMFIRNTNWAKLAHSLGGQQQELTFAFSWSDIKEIDEVLLWLQTDDPYFDRYGRPYRLRRQDRQRVRGGAHASASGGGKIGADRDKDKENECSCSESEECDVDIHYFMLTSDDNGSGGGSGDDDDGDANKDDDANRNVHAISYANADEHDDDEDDDDDDEYCMDDDAATSARQRKRALRGGGGGKGGKYGRSFIATRKTRSRARADPTVIMKEKLAECKPKCDIKRWRRRRIKVKHSKEAKAEYILRRSDDFSGIYHALKHKHAPPPTANEDGNAQAPIGEPKLPTTPPPTTTKPAETATATATTAPTTTSPQKKKSADADAVPKDAVTVEYAKHLRTIADATDALYTAVNPQVWGTGGKRPMTKTIRTAKEHLLKWYLKILSSFSDEKISEWELTPDFVEYHDALKIIEETKIFGKKGHRRLPPHQQLQQQALPPAVHITPQRALAQTTGQAARAPQPRRPRPAAAAAPTTQSQHTHASSAHAPHYYGNPVHAYYPNYQPPASHHHPHAHYAAYSQQQQQQQQQQQHRAMYYANANNANAGAGHTNYQAQHARPLNTRDTPITIPSSANTSVHSSPNRNDANKTQAHAQMQTPQTRMSEEPLFNVASQRQYDMDRDAAAMAQAQAHAHKYQLHTPPQHTIYQRRHYNTQAPPPPQPAQHGAYYAQPPAPFAPPQPPPPPLPQHAPPPQHAYYPQVPAPAAAPWMYAPQYASHLYPSPYMGNGAYFPGYNRHLRHKLAGDAEKLKKRQIEERQKLDDHKHFLQQDLDSHLNLLPQTMNANANANGDEQNTQALPPYHAAAVPTTWAAAEYNGGGMEASAAYNVNRQRLFESLKGPVQSATTISQSNKKMMVQPPLRVHKNLVDSIRASSNSNAMQPAQDDDKPAPTAGPRPEQAHAQEPVQTQQHNNDTDSTLSTMTVKSQVTSAIDSDATTTTQAAAAEEVVNLKIAEHNTNANEPCGVAITAVAATDDNGNDSDGKISPSPSNRQKRKKSCDSEQAVTVEFAPLNKVLRVIKDIQSNQNEIQRMPFDSNTTTYSDHESDTVDAAATATAMHSHNDADVDVNMDAEMQGRDTGETTVHVPQSPKQRAMKRPRSEIEREHENGNDKAPLSPPSNKRLKFDLELSPSKLPKFDPNMSTDELIQEIRKHDASYDVGNRWCRYCGARAAAKWITHNKMVMCYAHSQSYKKDTKFRKKIDSYKRIPRTPINDADNTQHQYLESKLKRLIAAIQRVKS